jgi:hypothetical protein
MSFTPPSLSLNSPAEAVSVVPYLLGFHPHDSIVVIAVRQRRVHTVARFDLPADASQLRAYGPAAQELARRLSRHDIDTTVVIGYGPHEPVAPAVAATTNALIGAEIHVHDTLRVADARWWSLTCTDKRCCPPEGTAFDAASSVAAATAVAVGLVALPDRHAVADVLTPVQGAPRQLLRTATTAAIDRMLTLANVATEDRSEALRSGVGLRDMPVTIAVFTAALATLTEALHACRFGQALDDDTAASLTTFLSLRPVRDLAIRHAAASDWQIALWSDLVRRAEPPLIAGPAVLLAVTALLQGNGVLAEAAAQRALDADPDYELAHLLLQLVRSGIDPDSMAAAIAEMNELPGDSR